MHTNVTAPDRKPALVPAMLHCRCPRCRRGQMFSDPNPYHFKNTLKMNEVCSECGQPFDIEVGFYYGTSYVSYALTIALSAATFVAWWVLIGLSIYDNRIFYWLIGNIILLAIMQPVFMRLARTIWLAFFVYYDSGWKENPAKPVERMNEGLKDAW